MSRRFGGASVVMLVVAMTIAACGDGGDGGGASVTATPTRLEAPEPTTTPTPLASAGVRLMLNNGGAAMQEAMLSGTRLSGPTDSRATAYGPIAQSVAGHGTAIVGVPALAPGVWLHRIEVAATGQRQYRQSLVVDDPAASNALAWTVFATVLSVNEAKDDGGGFCDDTSCTLRDAVESATNAAAPVLVVFDHARLGTPSQVEVIDERIFIQSAGLTLDGTDENGDPSPVVDFAERTFPARITLRGTKEAQLGGPSSACPCTQDYGGTLFAGAAGVVFVGLHVDRVYPPQKEICCGDQALIELGKGALNGRVDTCLLDGGGRAITDAVTPMGRTGQATSKDCVKPERTGSTPEQPVTVTNSELSYCLDRGVKVQDDFLLLTHNWIHNNLRCAMFAIVPQGSITVDGNLIEENGMNCPSGAPPHCERQVVTRPDAPQVSAQGTGTSFLLDGNVVRHGPLSGVFWQVGSTGTLTDTFVCGMVDAGILSERRAGEAADATVRGTASVLNGGSGVEVRQTVAIDLGNDGAADAGNNAFAGNPDKREVFNNMSPAMTVLAQGNQWQSCYGPNASDGNSCDVDAIAADDTNDPSGSFSLVDVRNPQPQQAQGTVTLTSASPVRVAEGGLIGLTGSGFDAVSGVDGLTREDCDKLATTNTCSPLHGTCVEFMVDGSWTPAADILGVTPTFVMVRSPLTCTAPTQVRVRRAVLGGGEAISDPLTICTN